LLEEHNMFGYKSISHQSWSKNAKELTVAIFFLSLDFSRMYDEFC